MPKKCKAFILGLSLCIPIFYAYKPLWDLNKPQEIIYEKCEFWKHNCITKLKSQQCKGKSYVPHIKFHFLYVSLLKNAKTSFVLNRGFHWVKKKNLNDEKRFPLISQALQMSFQNKANNCCVQADKLYRCHTTF